MAWEIVDIHQRSPEAAAILAAGAFQRDPENSSILDTQAWAEVLCGDYEKSISHFEKAFDQPTLADKCLMLCGVAISQARLGRVDAAWDALARSVGYGVSYNLPEAYVEVRRAGNSTDRKQLEEVHLALERGPFKPERRPAFEVLTAQPRASEPVQIVYRPQYESRVQNREVVVKWGVNRWQYPRDQARTTDSAIAVYHNDCLRPVGIQEPMRETRDECRAALTPPRWARQIDVTFLDITARKPWGTRGREAHVKLFPPTASNSGSRR